MTEPSPHVTTERLDSVMVVHLDDGKANALSATMIAAISTALDEAEADDTIGAVVLHGRPGRFCAGFDLSVMRGGDFAAVATLVSDGGELVRRLYGSSVPIVAGLGARPRRTGRSVSSSTTSPVGVDWM